MMPRQRSSNVCTLLVLCLLSGPLVNGNNNVDDEAFFAGNELCPCLSAEELIAVDAVDLNNTDTQAFLGNDYLGDLSTYGVGCAKHDQRSAECSNPACRGEENVIPKSLNCDNSYCNLNFCYVDPNNCQLLNRRSLLFPNTYRFYSYATCWDVDSFTSSARISALESRIFRVGFNSNSGGWQGAYSKTRTQFEGPVDLWSGPTVDFAIVGAERGRYQMNLTVPPPYLKSRSQEYFNSGSNFDYCVYATSLGYLDFCLAQYTITNQRASTTDWLVLGSQDLHLIVKYEEPSTGFEKFNEQVRTIFLPFQDEVWIFLIFFVIPVLGMLMIVHEYDHPGSPYPKTEDVLVKDNKRPGSIEEVETRKVPMYRHIARAVYINLLSVLIQAYSHSVVTYGAMLNLLGISFFILTIIAVYTANLAAILTQKAQRTTIGGLEDALNAGFRICSERKNFETVQALFPQIQDQFLAADPVDTGGDGLAGFNCPSCAARVRVFDFLDPVRAETDSRYCHAAFAPLEDLEVEQRMGRHCNKTIIGTRIGSTQTGIPVNELVSSELISWFLNLKNDGVFDRELITDKPEPQCPEFDEGGEEGESLTIAQLTGIWVVSFGFAFAGLLVTWLQPKVDAMGSKSMKPVHQYDQNGSRINVVEKDDDWIDEKSILKGSKRIYVGDSRWAKASQKAGGTKLSSTAFDVMSKRVGASRKLNIEDYSDGDDDDDDDDGIFSEQKSHRPYRSTFSGAPEPLMSTLPGSRSSFQTGNFPHRYSSDTVPSSQLESLAEEASEDLLLESSIRSKECDIEPSKSEMDGGDEIDLSGKGEELMDQAESDDSLEDRTGLDGAPKSPELRKRTVITMPSPMDPGV